MTDLQKFQEALETYIRPVQQAIAIRMIARGEPLPPGVRRPSETIKEKVAICQGFSFARRYGWATAIGREDISCPLAKVVWGFEPMLDHYTNGMTCAGFYTATPEAGAVTEAQTPKFSYGQYEYVVAAPLSRTEFEPHVILIHGNSAQVMRLVVAALYKRGGRIHSSFSGRLDCADEVIATMQSNDYQVILPCHGDRVFAQTQDDEMAFAMPGDRIGEIVEGLAATHKNGIRYPTPNFMLYTGNFPKSYMEMEEAWKAAEQAAK